MNPTEREQLEALLRVTRQRLHALEAQAAMFGPMHTPYHIKSEIEEAERSVGDLEARLSQADQAPPADLRQRARKAYFAEEWAQAVALLGQVVAADPDDEESAAKLKESRARLEEIQAGERDDRRRQRLAEDYRDIRGWRDQGETRIALRALDDLERWHPGFPDPDGLRAWAAEIRNADKKRPDQT